MRKYIICYLLLCCLVLVSGCTGKENIKTETKEPVKQVQQIKEEKQSFIIYRAAADGTEVLLPEHITITANGKSKMENAIIALISTKPQNAKYADVVPIGTKLLGLKVENGLATVNFSKDIAQRGQGSYEELMLTYAIVNTLTEFPEIKKVQILVEGKKVASFNGHMDLEDPLTRNSTLLPKK